MLEMVLLWHEEWRFEVRVCLEKYMMYAIEHEWAPGFPKKLNQKELVSFLKRPLEAADMKYLIDLWPRYICNKFDVTKTQRYCDVLERNTFGLCTEADKIWMRSARILQNCIKRRLRCQAALQLASLCILRCIADAGTRKKITQLVWNTRNDSAWVPPTSPLEKRTRYSLETAH
jgi:hypothetical protein